ncbi:MAG TPA: hypothetical protein VJ741_11215, partial [Solirubrobacteraceae bacterium]|nr:hypothetical protein [Solirubrobacteraceae bacterium]
MEVFDVWPGAAPECPWLVEIGLEKPVTWAGAVLLDEAPAWAEAEPGFRPAAALGVGVWASVEDFVPRAGRAGWAPRFAAPAAGETSNARVRCEARTVRPAGVPWRPAPACEPACVSLSTP